MKVKKVLKWTGIIAVAGLGGALIASPELRSWVVEKAQDGFNTIKGMFTEDDGKGDPEPAPKREGRNNGGYYKPRYNNKKN